MMTSSPPRPIAIPMIVPFAKPLLTAALPEEVYTLSELMDQYASAKALGLAWTKEAQVDGQPD